MTISTIAASPELKIALKKIKIHPRESFESVIWRLMNVKKERPDSK